MTPITNMLIPKSKVDQAQKSSPSVISPARQELTDSLVAAVLSGTCATGSSPRSTQSCEMLGGRLELVLTDALRW